MGRPFEVSKFLFLFSAYFGNVVVCQINLPSQLAILPPCILGADNVDFYLFNRAIPRGVVVRRNARNIPINTTIPTVFMTHGFISEANTTEYFNLTSTLVDQYNSNVFSVDWKQGACSGGITLTELLSYPQAVSNTRSVGENIAKFIAQLIREHGLKLKNIYLIGHSLGAHVVGFAGKHLQQQKTGTVPQIIGLDPAGPGFENSNCSNRICESDADFVQIFHTSYLAGIHREVGDVDFYFNGGSNQPGCPLLTLPVCSHSSAIGYLIDILQNPDCKFIGWQWKRSEPKLTAFDCTETTCSIPGPFAGNLPARGTFYVDTKNLPSFCSKRLI